MADKESTFKFKSIGMEPSKVEKKFERVSSDEIFSAIASAGSHQEYYNSKRIQEWHKEKEKPYWLEAQINDSFKLKFKDDKLIVTYTVETMTPARLDWKHETHVDSTFKDIVNFIKRKYKELTGKAITLKQFSDILEHVDQISNRRQLRHYISVYEIGGVESPQKQNEKDVKDLLKSMLNKGTELGVFRKK